jgi:hypothetical protein
MMTVSQYVFRSLNYSCFMLLIKFFFCVYIIELENMLSQVKNEFQKMKEEAAVARKEEARKKEEPKRPKKTTKDTARWWKDGYQGCSFEDVVAEGEPSCLVNYICFVVYIYMEKM